jgi:shikimate kinase
MSAPRKNIVLIGFMGSGKTAVGRRVAEQMRFQFVDTDSLIVSRAGMDIPAIFARHGEERFREMETAALESLSTLDRCVISTGGGIVMRERNRELLRALGVVVWLTADEDTIFERVSRNTKRPLLQTENPRETVSQLLAARRPIYTAAADATVDTTGLSHASAAKAVIAEARRAFSWKSAE